MSVIVNTDGRIVASSDARRRHVCTVHTWRHRDRRRCRERGASRMRRARRHVGTLTASEMRIVASQAAVRPMTASRPASSGKTPRKDLARASRRDHTRHGAGSPIDPADPGPTTGPPRDPISRKKNRSPEHPSSRRSNRTGPAAYTGQEWSSKYDVSVWIARQRSRQGPVRFPQGRRVPPVITAGQSAGTTQHTPVGSNMAHGAASANR